MSMNSIMAGLSCKWPRPTTIQSDVGLTTGFHRPRAAAGISRAEHRELLAELRVPEK